MSRRRLLRAALGTLPAAGAASLGGALLAGSAARAQPAAGSRPGPPTAATITTTSLATPARSTSAPDGLLLLQGAGSNVVALPGAEGALLIDSGLAANAEALLRAVFDATGNARVAMLINTHWHPEQTGANAAVGRDGGVIFSHEKTQMYLSHTVYSSALFEGRLAPLPPEGRPTEVTRGDGVLEFEGTPVEYGYLPAAHTDGDLYVHFPDGKVLAAGGVLAADHWPLLDYRNGAWFGGRVRALEWLAELVEPDTTVVPAQGPVLTGRDVVRHRDMYRALFETMIEYMNKGFGPEDAVASNPLEPYQAEFGDPSEFLDGAYRSMLIAYVPD